MSLALFVSYAFIALFIVIILVLFCLGCHCSIPLRKIMLWCFSMRCCSCPQRTEKQERREKRADEAQVRSTESDYKQCFSWVPWALTCGYCCGQCTEEEEMKVEGPERAPLPMVIAQPVYFGGDEDDAAEVVGTEAVVSSHMPLLRL